MKMREISEKEVKVKQHLLESPSHQKVTQKLSACTNAAVVLFCLISQTLGAEHLFHSYKNRNKPLFHVAQLNIPSKYTNI